MKIETLQFIITLIILIFLIIRKYIVPSYFSQKGKNLADKQDVENLTKKIENIKSSFNEKIEYLRTDLNFKNQNRISVTSYEREAILNVNEKYAEWLNSLMNISFSLITVKNYSLIENYFSELKDRKIEFENSEAKLHIFMNDDELMKVKSNCHLKTLEIEYLVKKTTSTLLSDFERMDFYFNNIPSETKEQIDSRQSEYLKAMDGISEIISGFYKKRADIFTELHVKKVQFISLLQERLLKIMKK
jgi:hypothetical protein